MIGDGSLSVGFGRVDGYTPPRWPDPAAPKQFHLDFYVEDLDKAEAACLEPGRPSRTTSRAPTGGGC